MSIDLHSHTDQSDGSLSPQMLIELAEKNGVQMLSITDHDTVSAYHLINYVPKSMHLIKGVEISCSWNNATIHILGLDINITEEYLLKNLEIQSKQRLIRAGKIAKILVKLGITDPLTRVMELAGNNIGRPHFAQYLLEIGKVRTREEAFKKYLGNGKPGDVKFEWMEMKTAIECIKNAGGIAVLAHPAAYKYTNTKLNGLLKEFKELGGQGIEVISGSQTSAITNNLTSLAIKYDFFGSQGSDFHEYKNGYSSLGKCVPLSPSIQPVWNLF